MIIVKNQSPRTKKQLDKLGVKGVIEIPIVYVDSREPEELVFKLEGLGLTVIIDTLPTGDIIVNGYVIERKEVNDFRQSYIKPRLKEQVGRLEDIPNSVLVIEGDWDTVLTQLAKCNKKNFSHFREKQILLKMYRKTVMSTPVRMMRTKNLKETAELVYNFAMSGGDSKSTLEAVRESPGRGLTNDEWQRRLLEGLQQVGPKRSHKWLMQYGSVAKVLNAMINRVNIIRDFTKETELGKKIQKILHHKYGKEDEKDE